MPPTESSILSNFLVPPAPLPVAISLQQFVELFPRSQQSSHDIQLLYRELQHQRALDIDDLKKNIAAEVQRGEKQKRQVIRARRKAHQTQMEGLDARDIQMEAELQESTSTKSHSETHTEESILPEMEDACEDLDEEIIAMEKEAAAILEDIRTTVGDLSDLRYGRFSRVPGVGDDLGKETLEGLKRLEQVCNDIGSRSSGVLEV